MRNKRWTWLAAVGLGLLVVFLTPTVAFPQGPSVTVAVASVDPKTFPEISAAVAVADANGISVPNLTRGEFQVHEDGQAVTIKDVKTFVNPDAPIAVCLAIDVSGSMKGQPLQDAKAAAKTFIDSLGPKDQACIVAFSDKVDLSTPLVFNPAKEINFTNDKNALKNLIEVLAADTNPGTPLYDAAVKAIKITASQPPGTRAVILFTDGKDERLAPDGTTILPGSVSAADRPISAAKEARVPVFPIGLGKEIDATYLQRLAEQTGGKYQDTPTSDKLTELFQSIARQLKTQYTVAYTSLLFPDSKDHTLQIKVRTLAGEAETRTTFSLPRDVVINPFIRLYYKEGDQRKDLTDGLKFKGTVLVAPEIATSRVISVTMFLVDNAPVYTATSAPWTFTWNTCSLTPGLHTLAARAQDDQGRVGEKSAQVEIVPGGLMDCVIAPSPVAQIGIAGLALLSLLVVGIVMLRVRRRPTLCPRGLHVMPPGAVVCPFCAAEVERIRTAEAGAALPPPPPPSPPAYIRETEGMPVGPAPAEFGRPMETVSLRRPPVTFAFLVMERGDHPGREFTLHAGDTAIGRAGTNDIVVDDSTVGRQQAKIKAEGRDFYLYDLAATNPTLVNGRELRGRHRLMENDRIQMGNVAFLFKQVR